MSIDRIAIVNRGEPAVRLINAAREYGHEHHLDISTIALYTDADESAMFVRMADEAIGIGPAMYTDDAGRRRSTYLDLDRLEQVLTSSRADAVWVGWGFVAEHAPFVDLCERLGITFIGPSAAVMRRLGDKITSKQIADASDVPSAAWSGGPVETIEEAIEHADRIGYPVLVKATAGGGGRGIRRVTAADELGAAFESARDEARSAFGNDGVFIEELVGAAKHIEVQIIGDAAGTVWPVGVRDCSVQRSNQKIIEEAPSPSLSAEQTQDVCDAARRLGEAAGYQNAGTVEFLFQPETGRFSFMEVNARLQVEHPITEMTAGVDMVKLQLHVAAGGHLEGPPPLTTGHAIEARINAEDPERGFAPSTGRIDVLRLPTGPGLRVDTGVEERDEISENFDSMIAKIIAHGNTRDEAIARLRRALEQTDIMLRHGTTNKAFVADILDKPEFRSGEVDVSWIDRLAAEDGIVARHAELALIAAAIDASRAERKNEIAAFRASALRGRPEIEPSLGRTIELRHRGKTHRIEVRRFAPGDYRITIDGHLIEVDRKRLRRATTLLTINGTGHRVVSRVHGTTHLVEVDGQPHRILHDEAGVIRSPAPAVVVAFAVAEGDQVQAGDRLAVIEAMKMETSITAEFAGTVREISARLHDQVQAGGKLLVMEPSDTDETVSTGGGELSFAQYASVSEVDHDQCVHWLVAIRQLLLGYDLDAPDVDRLARPGTNPCGDEAHADQHLELEHEVLSVFADVLSLFGHATNAAGEPLARHGTESYLFEYLRHVDAQGAGLPDSFVTRLKRTLRRFGVDTLEPHADLHTALARIVRSHQRMDRQIGPVLRLIERRLDRPVVGGDEARRAVLEEVVAATRTEHPAIHDLVRDLIYRESDEPLLMSKRWTALEEAEAHVDALNGTTDPDDREQHIQALVDCSQPLKTKLARRLAGASASLRSALLIVMTRRYYRARRLGSFAATEVDGFSIVSADDTAADGGRVVTAHLERNQLESGTRALATFFHGAGETHANAAEHLGRTDLDIYLWANDAIADDEELIADFQRALDDQLGAIGLRRIVVAISDPTSGEDGAGVRHATFLPTGDSGYEPREVGSAMHPMLAERLGLWMLDNFAIEQLPTDEGVFLFHGVAHDNRRDERLFAIAEVRDLSAVRDDAGELQRLPELERVVHAVCGAIRRVQAQRASGRRLEWNRITLYVWPEFDLSQRDIGTVVARLAPEVERLGVQKVQVLARVPVADGYAERVLELTDPSGSQPRWRTRLPSTQLVRTMTPHEQNIVRLRQRGLTDPYELLRLLSSDTNQPRGLPEGDFQEYDIVDEALVPVDRAAGENTANIVVGVISNRTEKYPDGMRRVILVGDPSRGMGNVAEGECRRIIAGLDLATELGIPVEWFAVSAGARIAMNSGTENMDWISRVLRRLIEFTQAGNEVNIIVTGINVGAQPYWNAEATMLMHTRGVLIQTETGAMVLTGKDSLDYSGGVSAENNLGIGGYERIMGPNGQAQYHASDLVDACRILLLHYEFTYIEPGEANPRSVPSSDPIDRDIREHVHGGEFATIADVFSEATNPGRKKPFDIRQVMSATIDQDQPSMERWYGMSEAEVPVVWDAYIGGRPVCLLGFETKNLPRTGFVPADGPERWTSSTLFPRGSKKVARAINATSGNRPLVVLASLSGFDGSPESMRTWQLEFGAEIGRAIVNFKGPIVFCVVSRYHGGAFVVFSGALNENMEVAALEGSHASVIGGAPAAAVVFARDVRTRTEEDPRVVAIRDAIRDAPTAERARRAADLQQVRAEVHADKVGEVAAEFDAIHDVNRAQRVGSIDRIIPPGELRPYLIDAVERGLARAEGTR